MYSSVLRSGKSARGWRRRSAARAPRQSSWRRRGRAPTLALTLTLTLTSATLTLTLTLTKARANAERAAALRAAVAEQVAADLAAVEGMPVAEQVPLTLTLTLTPTL